MIIPAGQTNAGTYWYHFDGLGSVTALSNSSGTIVEAYSYSAYGSPNVHTAAGVDTKWLTSDDTVAGSSVSVYGNPYMFTGRRWDDETELYYYRARVYAPDLGRFLQPDPIGYDDGMNMYAYVGNNPLGFVDPTGLMKGYDISIHPDSVVSFTTESGQTETLDLSSATDLVMIMINASVSGDSITELQYIGHADNGGGGLLVGQNGNNSSGIWTFDTSSAENFPNSENFHINALESLIQEAFTSDAIIVLAGCNTAMNDKSIAMKFKEFLPDARIFGYTDTARINTFLRRHHAKEKVGSKFIEVGKERKKRKECKK